MPNTKVAVVTNSAIALPDEIIRDYNICLVPPSFTIDGRTYRDKEDIPLGDIYTYLEQDKPFLTTPGSPHDYLEAYREVSQRASAIACLTIPRELSTMFDSAHTAMEMAKDVLPGVSIRVLDCGTLAGAQGLIVLKAATRAMEGDSLEQVIAAADAATATTGLFILLRTARYTARTGRLPEVIARVGTLLNIKALITISGGRVRMVSLHRTMKAGIQRLIEVTVEKVGHTPVTAIVMHSGCLEEAEQLMTRVSDELPCTQVWLSQFSPIMAYITGPGAMGVAFCPTKFLYPESA